MDSIHFLTSHCFDKHRRKGKSFVRYKGIQIKPLKRAEVTQLSSDSWRRFSAVNTSPILLWQETKRHVLASGRQCKSLMAAFFGLNNWVYNCTLWTKFLCCFILNFSRKLKRIPKSSFSHFTCFPKLGKNVYMQIKNLSSRWIDYKVKNQARQVEIFSFAY